MSELREVLFIVFALAASTAGVGAVGAYAMARRITDEAAIIALLGAVCAAVAFGLLQ